MNEFIFESDDSHRYLIYDLETNEISYRKDPDGNWNSDEYKTNKIVFVMCDSCESGFTMGTTRERFDWMIDGSELYTESDYDETPHRVKLSDGFYMAVFPLTQMQWKKIMSQSISETNRAYDSLRKLKDGTSYSNIPAYPATFVDYYDADRLVKRLRTNTGIPNFDLPTEAQWEYACGCGNDSDDYWWGDNYPRDLYGHSRKVEDIVESPRSIESSDDWVPTDLIAQIGNDSTIGNHFFPYKSDAVKGRDAILGADVGNVESDPASVVTDSDSDVSDILIYESGAKAIIAESIGYAAYNTKSNTEVKLVGATGTKPNRWGLYNMLDNVMTWCKDKYVKDLGSEDQSDPCFHSVDPGETLMVVRGGCPDSVTKTEYAIFELRTSRRHAGNIKYYKTCHKDSELERHIGIRLVINKKSEKLAEKYFVVDIEKITDEGYYDCWFENIPDEDLYEDSDNNKWKTTRLVFTRVRGTASAKVGETGENAFHDSYYGDANVTSFWTMVFPVTRRQWELVMGSEFPNGENGEGRFIGSRYPMSFVNYCDCVQINDEYEDKSSFSALVKQRVFSSYLKNQNTLQFTLPSEIQWEVAARTQNGRSTYSTTKYPWGDGIDENRMWYWKNSKSKLHPVGIKSHSIDNGVGLYDMNGLVSEWCRDWYSYKVAAGEVQTRNFCRTSDKDNTGLKCVRGGNWDSWDRETETAHRGARDPKGNWSDVGFRLIVNEDIPEDFTTTKDEAIDFGSKVDTLVLIATSHDGKYIELSHEDEILEYGKTLTSSIHDYDENGVCRVCGQEQQSAQ